MYWCLQRKQLTRSFLFKKAMETAVRRANSVQCQRKKELSKTPESYTIFYSRSITREQFSHQMCLNAWYLGGKQITLALDA